jgi:tetratricopeptide (TPR) repeat protein
MKTIVLLLTSIVLLHAQDKARAQQAATEDALRLGVEAYKSAKYAEAARFFQKVVDLNPQALESRLYLGISCVAQYMPGSESPQNLEFASRAEAQFRRVLAVDDQNETAIAWLANLKYMQAQVAPDGTKKDAALDEAAKWYRQEADVNPDNPEAHFTLGAIAWNKWFPHGLEARARLGMKPEDPGPLKDDRIRQALEAQYRGLIEDGISHLHIALAMNPEREDAMTYLNMLIRARADLASSQAAYNADIQESDAWGQKAIEIKKRKAAAQRPGAPQAEPKP